MTADARPDVDDGVGPAGSGTTTVWYDGECPLCAREIGLYRRLGDPCAISFIDLTVSDAGLTDELSREAALARLHVRLPDGRVASGGAAFSALWQQIPGFRWLGRLTALPWLVGPVELLYRLFLRVRPGLQRLIAGMDRSDRPGGR